MSTNHRAAQTARIVLPVLRSAGIDKPCESFFYLDARYVAAVLADCRALDANRS